MPDSPILVINSGSSSLKLGLFCQSGGEERLLVDGEADGIGKDGGTLAVRDVTGRTLRSEKVAFGTQRDALRTASRWFAELSPGEPVAVGHRVVHGGPRLVTHQRITPDVLAELRASVHFAPLHIPEALELIAEATRTYPDVPQFACLDTAFHRSMPEVAARFALPRALFDQGIRRYGFHGLSYESIVDQLGDDLPGKTVIAHLGSGASLAAVKDGQSVDTSMGLTPTGGIPMATRSGDLDPGVLVYLLRTQYATTETLESLLNHASGLAAVSGGTGDMRDLEAAANGGDDNARLAIEMFSAGVRKVVGAYAATLGGIEMLVFTGGIGEHSARVRGELCHGLEFLGISLDDSLNQAHARTISRPGSTVRVRVVPSQEDQQIARHCRALL